MKTLLSLALLATLAAVSSAQSLVVSGSLTTTDPTFRRPNGMTTLVAVDGNGASAAYDVYAFNVSQSGQYVVEMGPLASANYDTFLLIYQNAFDPSNALANLVNGSDDAQTSSFTVLPAAGLPPFGSRIATGQANNFNANGLSLVAGTTYYAVATAFSSNNPGGIGSYSIGIGGGPGTVKAGAVPEPATIAALGLGGLALLRRRKSA